MKRRIGLLVVLMAACTGVLVGLQAYWNGQAYRNTTRAFRREVQEALTDAAGQEIRLRQHALLHRYREWLADTNSIRLQLRALPLDGSPVFVIADKHPWPGERRAPYDIGFADFPGPVRRLDPAARAFFLRRFTAGLVASDVRQGLVYYYTRSLGDRLHAAYQADRVDSMRLRRLYAQALHRRGIDTPFRLDFAGSPLASPAATGLVTRAVNVSAVNKAGVVVRAGLPDPDLVYLDQMKWVLLSSLGLVGIVVGCFAYAVRALRSQEQLAELKNDFVNNMTHELKTPVATIAVTAEALNAYALNPVDTAEYLAIIRAQASRLGRLLDKVLESAVLESARPALDPQLLDLAALVAQAAQQALPQLAERRQHLNLHLPPTPRPVFVAGDPLHLANVLATLLDNAYKYADPASEIVLGCNVSDGAAVVRLTSHGAPIPTHHQPRVFEKFFRVPTGNRHDVPGYGLGLHYARQMAARHGGRLTLECRGTRTTFVLTLPLAAHATHAPVAAPRR
ncbi:hypothetical protein D0N36_14450 [Hymenobacter lapidiphilus]|uniref:sensor histidine kinase n=1 Tax=Hymenobacter sp. CCM 8763 TaxID=2303334 RepID=UPI000E3430F4|nr:ATP-binding protein [Hymenobacter sp. CCM 8763]RFP64386.1 hypothetical protein D0N36_14450 [Hymenobacter sp. CCM 8763]